SVGRWFDPSRAHQNQGFSCISRLPSPSGATFGATNCKSRTSGLLIGSGRHRSTQWSSLAAEFGAKDSDEHQVALRRRKTTTKRSQRREHDQLPHPWVHLQDTFHLALILEAPRPAW